MTKSKYYGMTLYKFMTEHAEKGIDYTIEELEGKTINTYTFEEECESNEELRLINTFGRIVNVDENEEECVIYMKHMIYVK